MDPKMTAKDAADFLGISTRQVYKRLLEYELPYQKSGSTIYFGYPTARQLFRLELPPTSLSFQIVKGGTGKTSLAYAVAVRANLYGLRVLCIDLDQQGNLTSTFGVDADSLPVMIDILAEGYSYEEAITRVYPGMDLLASRIENSLLDEVIKLKKAKLDEVYATPLQKLKEKYDVIIIDCPPNLGQSVAAVTLAVDKVVAPVIPESYSISGLTATKKAVSELQQSYHKDIDLLVTINKFSRHAALKEQALQVKTKDMPYVHLQNEFPNAIARGESIYDSPRASQAKRDIDALTRNLIDIDAAYKTQIATQRASEPQYVE